MRPMHRAREHSNRAPASLRTSHLRFMIAVHCGAGYHSQALEAAYKRGESGRFPGAAAPWACTSVSRDYSSVSDCAAWPLQTSERPAGRARPRWREAVMPWQPSLPPSKCSRQVCRRRPSTAGAAKAEGGAQ